MSKEDLILTSSAGKSVRHVHKNLKILCLGLREAVYAGDIVLDSEVLRDFTVVSGFNQITRVRASSISIHLV